MEIIGLLDVFDSFCCVSLQLLLVRVEKRFVQSGSIFFHLVVQEVLFTNPRSTLANPAFCLHALCRTLANKTEAVL